MALVTHRHRHVSDRYVLVTSWKKRQDLERQRSMLSFHLSTIRYVHIAEQKSIFFLLWLAAMLDEPFRRKQRISDVYVCVVFLQMHWRVALAMKTPLTRIWAERSSLDWIPIELFDPLVEIFFRSGLFFTQFQPIVNEPYRKCCRLDLVIGVKSKHLFVFSSFSKENEEKRSKDRNKEKKARISSLPKNDEHVISVA